MAHSLGFLLLLILVFHRTPTFVTCDKRVIDPLDADDRFHHKPVPYPEQQKCDDITARKLNGCGTSEGDWAVVKVTPLQKPLPSQFDLNTNFCSPFSYVPEVCREMLMEIIHFPEDHSLTLHTFAYNNSTKSTVHFANNAKVQDKYYAIYQGTPALMEEYYDDDHYRLDNPIPNVVLQTQGEMFAKIAKSQEDKWMIFQNCYTQIAWVVVSGDIKIKDLPMYEKEYMAELVAQEVDVNYMVDVPIEDATGKSFRQCMYSLSDIVNSSNMAK